MLGRAGEAVKLPDGDRLKVSKATLGIRHELIERRPRLLRPGPALVDVLMGYRPASRDAHGPERLELGFGILMGMSLRNPRVEDDFHLLDSRIMQISRRGFLGGIVASATMAEAGAMAELLNWLRRKPISVLAPAMGWPGYGAVEDAEVCSRATRMFLSRDGMNWRELAGVSSVDFKMKALIDRIDDFRMPIPVPIPIHIPSFDSAEIAVRGDGFFPPIPDLLEVESFRLEMPDGLKVIGELCVSEVTQEVDRIPQYSFKGSMLGLPALLDLTGRRQKC